MPTPQKMLPSLKGKIDARAETEIYQVITRLYEYIDAKIAALTLDAESKAKILSDTKENLNSLIGVFAQPLAGSNSTDPLLQSIMQNFGIQLANTGLFAPSGAAGNPSFRLLVAVDIPNLDAAKITTGILAIAKLDTKVIHTDDALTVDVVGAPNVNTGKAILKDNAGNQIKVMVCA